MEGLVDKLKSMSFLLSAVEAGSLSAASRKMGVPLATLSRKVSKLETHCARGSSIAPAGN